MTLLETAAAAFAWRWALVALLAAAPTSMAGQRIHIVVTHGDNPFGEPMEWPLNSFNLFPPSIDESDGIVFLTYGSDMQREPYGLCHIDSDSARWVVRAGAPLPGPQPEMTLDYRIYDYGLLPSGRVAFAGRYLTPSGPGGDGIWIEGPDGIQPVVISGQPASGQPGDVFLDEPRLIAAPDDSLLVLAKTSFGFGFWRFRDGRLNLIVRRGMQAPGFDDGVSFRFFRSEYWPNEDHYNSGLSGGDFSFIAGLVGPGISEGNNMSIWRADETGALSLIIREGDQYNGAAIDIRAPLVEVDADGSIVFQPWLTAPDGSVSSPLLQFRVGAISTVLTPGEAVPEFGPGATIDDNIEWSYDGQNSLTLLLSVRGPTGAAIPVHAIQRQGARVYVLRSGTRISTLFHDCVVTELIRNFFDGFQTSWTSPTGRAAFFAQLSANGLNGGSQAVVAPDRVGRLRVAARTGGRTNSGDVRTIDGFRAIGIGPSGDVFARVDSSAGPMIIRAEVDCPALGCDYADVANNDCRVDISDLAMVLSHFGETAGPADQAPGDADLNGRVDISDLAEVMVAFGNDCSTSP